ncbi:MAG: peptidylprolyl isomerase [Flavobacteriales bacterium]|nr:peptidylprolyl isomerase [Flavobacteriales bacterium]MCB0758159.1 peptidylprolyl isomerase [Flavobacteriales bacterium]
MALLAGLGTTFGQAKTAGKRHLVEINTTAGRMVVELYNETPLHRDNFLKLVRQHFYDSTLFHRVIPGFMIQGGDPDSRKAEDRAVPLGQGGPGYTVPAEINPELIHRKGALAAARLGDDVNPEKRSSGSQFYIVQGRTWRPTDLAQLEARINEDRPGSLAMHYTPDQVQTYANLGGAPHLDGGYTIFGQVVSGMEALDLIANQPCDNLDRPLADVRMWMRVLQ